MKRILTVVGNRPQFVKAAAVSRCLIGRFDEVLVDSGQHYDHELSGVFYDELGLPPPAHSLGAGSGSHAQMTAAIIEALDPLLAEIEPDACLIYGDTNTTLAAALVCAKAGLPLAHVEAGMRSFDRTMPEEVNRVVADSVSDLLLCPTEAAFDNLAAEGRGLHARLVGDVMADIALTFGPIADDRSDILDQLNLTEREFILATAHRAGNVDRPEDLDNLIGVLNAAAELAPVVLPLHPRTAARLETHSGAELNDEVKLIEPLGYLDFTCALRAARAVLTDSGGAQKEAYLASVPCVTMRESTEWVETVELGWNTLVGLDADAAVEALEHSEERAGEAADPSVYGGGHAGERVTHELSEWLEQRERTEEG